MTVRDRFWISLRHTKSGVVGVLLVVLATAIGIALAETLFPDGDAVGSRVSLDLQTFTVAGILEPTPYADPRDLMPYNDMAFMPRADLVTIWYQAAPIFTSIRFTAKDSTASRAAVSQISAYFASAHPDLHLMITDSIQELKNERQTLSRIIAVFVFLSAGGLLVAAINLLNLMLIRIMRALGSTQMDIFRQFINESALMCIAGTVVGVLVSPQVYNLLQTAIVSGHSFASDTLGVDLLIGAVVGFLITVAFGLYPALLAKNTNTSLAVRAD